MAAAGLRNAWPSARALLRQHRLHHRRQMGNHDLVARRVQVLDRIEDERVFRVLLALAGDAGEKVRVIKRAVRRRDIGEAEGAEPDQEHLDVARAQPLHDGLDIGAEFRRLHAPAHVVAPEIDDRDLGARRHRLVDARQSHRRGVARHAAVQDAHVVPLGAERPLQLRRIGVIVRAPGSPRYCCRRRRRSVTGSAARRRGSRGAARSASSAAAKVRFRNVVFPHALSLGDSR